MNKTDRIRKYLETGQRIEEIQQVEFLAAGEYNENFLVHSRACLLYTSPSPRD